jgi:hypothetical protein
MAADGRFGGHIVSGHIDDTGTIAALRQDDNAVWYTVQTPAALLRYIVEKGNVTLVKVFKKRAKLILQQKSGTKAIKEPPFFEDTLLPRK